MLRSRYLVELWLFCCFDVNVLTCCLYVDVLLTCCVMLILFAIRYVVELLPLSGVCCVVEELILLRFCLLVEELLSCWLFVWMFVICLPVDCALNSTLFEPTQLLNLINNWCTFSTDKPFNSFPTGSLYVNSCAIVQHVNRFSTFWLMFNESTVAQHVERVFNLLTFVQQHAICSTC